MNRLNLSTGALLCLLAVTLAQPAASQFAVVEQQNPRIRVEQLASGLGIPWGMAFLSPTQLLLTERSGRLRLLDLENATTRELTGLPPIAVSGQGGFLDVAVGPDHAESGWLYFTYTKSLSA